MIVADNGSELVRHAAPRARRWSNDQLHTLGRVHRLRTFEVVDGTKLRN